MTGTPEGRRVTPIRSIVVVAAMRNGKRSVAKRTFGCASTSATGVKQLAFPQRSNVGRIERQERHGGPVAIDEFDLVGFTLAVNMNDGADVARGQPCVRHLAFENHERMFPEHLSYPE
jgi:hypothetical protein